MEKENNHQKNQENSRKTLKMDKHIVKDIHILKLNILGCNRTRAHCRSPCKQTGKRNSIKTLSTKKKNKSIDSSMESFPCGP
jgi:hypothetical protein